MEDKPSKDSSAAGRTEKQTQETWVHNVMYDFDSDER
jgi:hypothetical protein